VISWILYQYSRVIWAFDHDGGTYVQGLSAILTTLATIVLVAITGWYAKLSQQMLAATEASVRAGFLPGITGSIDFNWTPKGKDVLNLSVKNDSNHPIQIIRAKLKAGSIFVWTKPPAPPSPFGEEIKVRPVPITELAGLFLRPEQPGEAKFRITPMHDMDDSEWQKKLERCSLDIVVMVECSDISGRVIYSFKIHRNARTGRMDHECRSPSAYDAD
jgi:hypothetical protein